MKRSVLIVCFFGFLLTTTTPATIVRAQEDSPTFKKGLTAYFQGEYRPARKHFEQAVTESPNNVRYHFFLANANNRLGNDTQAIEGYRAALDRDTSHRTARKRLADLYYKNNDWKRATEHYRTLVSMEKASPNPENVFRLARSLFETGKYDEARSEFLRVRKMEPRRPGVYFYLGRILLRNREYLNAVSRFNRAIELEDSRGRYYFYRGLSHFRQEDYLSDNPNGWNSAQNFQKAIDHGYESPRTNFMLANSLLNRGLYLKNQDRSTKAVELLKKSINQYRQVLASEWNASNAYHNMGVAYLGIGKLDLARRAVEQAILVEPTIPFFHDTLGNVYFEQGQFSKAIESWQLVRELNSDYDGSPFRELLKSKSIDQKLSMARVRQ